MELNKALRFVRSIVKGTENSEITLKADNKEGITEITVSMQYATLGFAETVLRKVAQLQNVEGSIENDQLFITDKVEADSAVGEGGMNKK